MDKSPDQKTRKSKPSLEGIKPENRTPEIAFVKGRVKALRASYASLRPLRK